MKEPGRIKDLATLRMYSKGMQFSPENARIYDNLGNPYKKMGKAEAALTFMKKAAGLAPNDHSVLMALQRLKEELEHQGISEVK